MTALDRAGVTIGAFEQRFPSALGAHAAYLVLNAGLSALAAELSWRLLESRMLRLKERFA